MTSPYTWILVSIAVVVWLLARDLPRARLWIALGGADFFLTTIYYDLGLPNHPAMTLAADASVCLTIYFLAKEEWEVKGLYRIFQLSVLFSVLKLAKFIEDDVTYATLLELANLAALICIGGTAIMNRANAHGHGYLGWGDNRVLRFGLSLRKARSTASFLARRR